MTARRSSVQPGAGLADAAALQAPPTSRALPNSQANVYVAIRDDVDLVERLMPAEARAQWDTEIKPYLEPVRGVLDHHGRRRHDHEPRAIRHHRQQPLAQPSTPRRIAHGRSNPISPASARRSSPAIASSSPIPAARGTAARSRRSGTTTRGPTRSSSSIDADKAKAWIAKGALPSDTVARLFRNAGVLPAEKAAKGAAK